MKTLTLKEEIKQIHENTYGGIWETHESDIPKDPLPFEFEWKVPDKDDDHEIPVTVSGFWNYYYKESEELEILDKVKNDITPLYSDEDTVNEIELYLKLNVL